MQDINIFRWSILSTELLLNNTLLIQLAASHYLHDKYEGIPITDGRTNASNTAQREDEYTIIEETYDTTTNDPRDDPPMP